MTAAARAGLCGRGSVALLLVTLCAGVCQLGTTASSGLREDVAAPTAAPTRAPASSAGPLQRAALLDQLGVERWHKAGRRGRGVTIAILDSGFRGYRNFLGNGLPQRVLARSFRKDGNLEARDSQHGILCAEIVHALAPEAQLLLANWETDQPASFLDAVRWARDQGARVVSCSVIMPGWSDGEGGGPVHAALRSILGTGAKASDLLLFASAGNTAQRHWSGRVCLDAAGRHQWQPNRTRNRIRPWGCERLSVELYGPRLAGLDLEVREVDSGHAVGEAVARGSGSEQLPWATVVVRFEPRPGEAYDIHVGSKRVFDKPHTFHLVVLGGSLEHATAPGSIPFPGDGDAVQTVGAVDGAGQRLEYSACGPNSRKPKPDLVAPVPFASLCRERPFEGTSAATPQAAGLAALWWSRHPDWTAGQVRDALHRHARDLGPPGHDFETGFGLIQLP